MRIDVDIDPARLLLRMEKGHKRFAYTVVNGLNNTAKRIQTAEREHVQSEFVIRKQGARRPFLEEQVAVIKRDAFASVKDARPYVEIEVGQKPRLLLAGFEAGAERLPFTEGAKSVAVPLTGRPARPSLRSVVPPAFTFKGLNLIEVKKGKVVRNKKGRSKRRRKTVSFTEHITNLGKVQYKGQHRTFILTQTKQAPLGGVFQRIGPERGDIRMIYSFMRDLRIDARLDFIGVAKRTADVWFKEELEREIVNTLVRQR